MAGSDPRVTFQLCPLHDVSNGNMFDINEDLLNVTGSILEQNCTYRHDFSTEPPFPQHILDQFGIARGGLCHSYMFAFSNGWAVGLTNDEYILMKRCGDRFEFVAGFKDISSAYQLGDGGTSVIMRDSGCIEINNQGDVSSSVVIRLPSQ